MKIPGFLLLLALAAPTPEIHHFRYERPIQTAGAGGQTCTAIDPAVFPHAAAGLADLRVYRGSSEIPYALHLASPPTPAKQQIAPLNLGSNAGKTVFDAAMPDGSYSDVELGITAHDFIATVTVTGSQEQAAPPKARTSLGVYTIFDLTRQKLGRSTVLHMPQSDFRFLHFRIDGPIAPADFSGLVLGAQPAAEPRYQIVSQTAHAVEKAHESVFEFELPAHTLVDRVAFVPSAQPASFSRDVSITVRPSSQPRREEDVSAYPATSAGNLLRLHRLESGHRIDEERLSVDGPAVTFDLPAHWTVTVENGDDPPLHFEAVRLEMIERDLCFDAAAASAYTLYYGDPALNAPQYDYARLFVAQRAAANATLRPEQSNSGYEPRPDDRPFTDRHPALLWIVLGLVVLVLGGVAMRSARTLKN
jgi:hypothetical protein